MAWVFGFEFYQYLTDKRLRSETVAGGWVGYYQTTKQFSVEDMDSGAVEMFVFREKISLKFSTFDGDIDWEHWEVESAISKTEVVEVNFRNGETLYIHEPLAGHYAVGYTKMFGEEYSRSYGPIPMLKLK